MFIYIHWKLDLNSENKFQILRISKEKEPGIKYSIPIFKYLLFGEEINPDYDFEQIFYTRLIVGTIKDNKLFYLISNTIYLDTNSRYLKIYISSKKSVNTIKLKDEVNNSLELYYVLTKNEPNVSDEFNREKKINQIIKQINKNNNLVYNNYQENKDTVFMTYSLVHDL